MGKDKFTKFAENHNLNQVSKDEFHSFKDNVFYRQNTINSQTDPKNKDNNAKLQYNPVLSIESMDIHVSSDHFQYNNSQISNNNNNNDCQGQFNIEIAQKNDNYIDGTNIYKDKNNETRNVNKNNIEKIKNTPNTIERVKTPKNKKYLEDMKFTDFKKVSSNIDTSHNYST